MINLLSEEHVHAFIEQRKQEFGFGSGFYVLTSKNHIFCFWTDYDVGIVDISCTNYRVSHQPKIAESYGAVYGNQSPYIRNLKTRKHLYNLFINDPTCLFFYDWYELKQELQHRGLL